MFFPISRRLYYAILNQRACSLSILDSQGATIFKGVFKEAATKGSGKLRRSKKGRGQDSEEISFTFDRTTNNISSKSDRSKSISSIKFPRVQVAHLPAGRKLIRKHDHLRSSFIHGSFHALFIFIIFSLQIV